VVLTLAGTAAEAVASTGLAPVVVAFEAGDGVAI
jgi:hypothetical protein